MKARSRTPDAIRQRQAPGRALYKTQRWKLLRKVFLRARPSCAACGRPARHVDHIRPHRGNEALFFDSSNWQSLCHSCHSSKTARSDGGFGNPARSEAALGACDVSGRPIDPAHPWNL